ncbi:hypothetical protein L249_6905, partial [Ophiocordyceps polyrhachis-furcata BCC 54312]
ARLVNPVTKRRGTGNRVARRGLVTGWMHVQESVAQISLHSHTNPYPVRKSTDMCSKNKNKQKSISKITRRCA